MAQPVPHALHRLFYRSRATFTGAGGVDSVIDEILRTSVLRNREAGITGLLLVIDDHFIQALEGTLLEVRNTYARISLDRRHGDLCIISQEPAQKRLFGDWSMCASAIAPSDKMIVDVLDTRGDFEPQTLTAASVQRLMTTVAEIKRRVSKGPATEVLQDDPSHDTPQPPVLELD